MLGFGGALAGGNNLCHHPGGLTEGDDLLVFLGFLILRTTLIMVFTTQ
jgi:hypothetical protein